MARTRTAKIALCCLLAVWIGGCGAEFDPQSLVNKFRILAVKSDPAEGAPGQQIVFTPLLSDSVYNRQPIHIWMTCLPHPGQSGRQCLEDGGGTEVGLEETLTITLPELADDEDEKEISVTLLVCAGIPKIPDFEKEDYDFCESPENDVAIKTVTIIRENQNNNPRLETLTISVPGSEDIVPQEGDRPTLECTGDCEEITLTLVLSPDSIETYETIRFEEIVTLEENPFISWFATAGEFNDSRTYESDYEDEEEPREELAHEVEWIPPDEGIDEEVTFYFVAYDGRGGVDYRTQVTHIIADAED